MNKFWDNHQPLSPEEDRLLSALFKAHAACVWRGNCSTLAFQQAAGGSKNIVNGFIGALSTMGELHGPVEAAYSALCDGSASGITPGLGNSFIKGQRDPAFQGVEDCLSAHWPRQLQAINKLEKSAHSRGKLVFANPAAYTAAVAIALGMPAYLSPLLFIMGRSEAWGELFHKQMTFKPESKKEAA